MPTYHSGPCLSLLSSLCCLKNMIGNLYSRKKGCHGDTKWPTLHPNRREKTCMHRFFKVIGAKVIWLGISAYIERLNGTGSIPCRSCDFSWPESRVRYRAWTPLTCLCKSKGESSAVKNLHAIKNERRDRKKKIQKRAIEESNLFRLVCRVVGAT